MLKVWTQKINSQFMSHKKLIIIQALKLPKLVCLSVHLSPSVCPSVCADSCPAHNFFMVWHWLTIFGTWVYNHETMCRVHSWSRYDLELWPQGQIYRVFDMFSCLAHNFFFGLTLAHHTWHMGVSPWDDVSSTFMIQIWPWT